MFIACLVTKISTLEHPLLSYNACTPKVLDEIPPPPSYDVSELTIKGAKKFAEFLSIKRITNSNELPKFNLARDKANDLANYILKEDEGLLAVAIAAPSLPLAVVQFRDKVNNTQNSSDFLSVYWRELGVAWNQSDGAQFWGAPFRDCGPLRNRWLWPFSITVVAHGFK